MKKLLAIVLSLIMVNAFSICVFAETKVKGKYEDVFQQYFEENVENLDNLDRTYKECYEYYSDSNVTEIPDWALVYAFCGVKTKPGIAGGAYVYTVCSD